MTDNGKENLPESPDKRRQSTVEKVAAYVKEQNRIRGEISTLLKERPMTVPEIAGATGIASSTVFWHIIAMRKYGKVAEAEQKDDYPMYRLISEVKQ